MKINYKKSPEMAIILLRFASGVFCTFLLIKMGHPRSLFSFFNRKKMDRTEQKSKARKRSLERIRTGSVVVTAFFTARYVQLKLFVRRRLDEG